MEDSKTPQQGAKDILNQVQDKASRAVDLAKWKLDQQSRLLRLGSDIRALENEVKANKVVLADTAFTMYGQGKIRWDELGPICKKVEQINVTRDIKVKEKMNVESEHPPQAIPNDFQMESSNNALTPTPTVPKIDNQLSALLSQSESALQRGDRGQAAGFLNEALKMDYLHPEVWALLQKILGSQQNLIDFQMEFTKKYFPNKLELLTKSMLPVQEPLIAQNKVVAANTNEQIPHKQTFVAASKEDTAPAQSQSEIIFYQDEDIYVSNRKVKYNKGEISASKIDKIWAGMHNTFSAIMAGIAGEIVVGLFFYTFLMGQTVSLLLLSALVALGMTVPFSLVVKTAVIVRINNTKIEIYVSKSGKKANAVIQAVKRAMQSTKSR